MKTLAEFDLIYLATPYTKFAKGQEEACAATAELSKKLWALGIRHYSPILEGHALSLWAKIDPHDHEFWDHFCAAKLRKCDAVVIGMLDGWEHSHGVARETITAMKAKVPVFWIDALTVEIKSKWSAS